MNAWPPSYNPANQIVTETRSNDAYSQVLANGTQTNVTNGLNQLSTVNGTAAAYDARGNMTTDPVTAKTSTYYGSNNQLYTNPSPYTVFGYDALDRLWYFNTGAPVTNYVSDGTDQIAEYDGNNVLQKRYAFDGNGNPLVAYDAAGNRTWMLSDERGSVVALANDSAAMTAIDTYDEYGIPAATNQGTFQYAGMMWLSRPGLYAPAFRSFNALLGRFNQTDPIGFGGGINLYGYTGGDPVNGTDPLGLTQDTSPQEIVVNACENGGVPDANGTCSSPELIPTFLTFGDTAIRVPPGYNCPSGFCTINVTGRRLTNNNKSLPNLTLQQQQKPRYCSTPAYKIGDFLRKTSEAGKHIAAIGAFAGLVQEGAAPVTAGGSAVTGTGTLALAGGAYLISASIGVVGSFLTQSASQQSKSNYESYAFATSALSFGGGLVQPTAMALADVATGNVTKSGAGENPCGD